jgi:hypothetical protein
VSPPYVAPSPLLATQSLVSINVQTVGHDRSESLIMTDSHRKYHHIYLYIYTYMSHQAAADSRSTLFMGAPKLLQIEAHVTPTTVQPYRG